MTWNSAKRFDLKLGHSNCHVEQLCVLHISPFVVVQPRLERRQINRNNAFVLSMMILVSRNSFLKKIRSHCSGGEFHCFNLQIGPWVFGPVGLEFFNPFAHWTFSTHALLCLAITRFTQPGLALGLPELGLLFLLLHAAFSFSFIQTRRPETVLSLLRLKLTRTRNK